MRQDITDYFNECQTCNRHMDKNKKPEDLPEDDKPKSISKEQNDYLMTLLEGREKAFVESIESLASTKQSGMTRR